MEGRLIAPLLLVLALAPAGGLDGALRSSPSRSLSEAIVAASEGARVIVLGERDREASGHGLFLELVRVLRDRGERVLVGLEISSSRQPALDKAVGGLRAYTGLAHPIIDGPSYRALLRGLGEMRASAAHRLGIAAVDGVFPARETRDEQMARSVLEALDGGRWERVALLVGNLHALKAIPWSAEVPDSPRKLSQILGERGVRVASYIQEGSAEHAAPALLVSPSPGVEGAVRRLWAGLNTREGARRSLAATAVDGLVAWPGPAGKRQRDRKDDERPGTSGAFTHFRRARESDQ